MTQWKVSSLDINKVFEHATWQKDSITVKIIKIYENIDSVIETEGQPMLVQDKGPFGQSVNILLENCQSFSLINESTRSVMFGDLTNENVKTDIEEIYSSQQDQGLIDNGFNRVKHEIWLTGPLSYERL